MTSLAVVSLNAVQGTHAFVGKTQLSGSTLQRSYALRTPRKDAGESPAGRHSTGADVLQRVDVGELGRLPAPPARGLDAARVRGLEGLTRAAVWPS